MGRRASDYTYRLGQIGKIGNKGKPDMGRGWKVIKATIAAAGVAGLGIGGLIGRLTKK